VEGEQQKGESPIKCLETKVGGMKLRTDGRKEYLDQKKTSREESDCRFNFLVITRS